MYQFGHCWRWTKKTDLFCLEITIEERLKKAVQTEKDAQRDFINLCESIGSEPINLESVRLWQSEEAQYFENELVNGRFFMISWCL